MKLSNQAIGALMLALQKSLLEQSDIVPVLKGFQLKVDDLNEVIITNPPLVHAKDVSFAAAEAKMKEIVKN